MSSKNGGQEAQETFLQLLEVNRLQVVATVSSSLRLRLTVWGVVGRGRHAFTPLK